MMHSKWTLSSLALCAALLGASVARADDAGADNDATAAAPASPHPAGVAERPAEAPGGGRLAALPGEGVPPHAQVTARGINEDAASSRAMAFGANGGECRDTIPGGPVLAAAYASILALLGIYAFSIGRKNATLGAQIDELERLLAKKAEQRESKGA